MPYRWYFLSLVLFVLGLLLYVWCQVRTLAQGELIVDLMEERKVLLQEQDLLMAEITGLECSSQIRERATLELGMRFPDEQPNNLYLDPAGTATNEVHAAN